MTAEIASEIFVSGKCVTPAKQSFRPAWSAARRGDLCADDKRCNQESNEKPDQALAFSHQAKFVAVTARAKKAIREIESSSQRADNRQNDATGIFTIA